MSPGVTALSKPALCAAENRIESLQLEYEQAQAAAKESQAAHVAAHQRAEAEQARAEAAELKLAALSQEAERANERVFSLELELAGAKTTTE